ncbi:poly-gamma-glutamate system protein [Leptospira sp. 'Mane']|uniref:poly-gamma-glutamate system protein n=1 Tax=Leptospira sp. 'Mane' TaxID=3387407 RepID=UPI00398B1DD6
MITRIYWSFWKHSSLAIALLALFAVLGLIAVESFKVKKEQPYFKKKMHAAKLAERAFQVLRPDLLKKKKPDYKDWDPANTGLIGEFLSPVTSNTGSLSSKQTSVNPNFAAVILHLLKRAKLEEGDTIAVAVSGSFPAMNICLFAALETLKLKPIIIASTSASQFGANHPQMLWLDMERILAEESVFTVKSSHASLGGTQDKAIGMSKEGKDYLLTGIKRNKVIYIDPLSFEDSIRQRMDLYQKLSLGKQIKAFINIGGGTTVLGTSLGKQVFKSGLITQLPDDINPPDSVIKEFLQKDIPVINVIQVESLARKFGLPPAPKKTPKPGEGKVFVQEEYNPWLCIGILLFLAFGLYGITKLGWGGNQTDFQLPETIRRK